MSKREIRVDSPEGGPPLLLLAKNRLTSEAIANLRASWEAAWQGDYPGPGPRIAILDGGFEVFQLIDGDWRKLD